jgi:hypothetical protein
MKVRLKALVAVLVCGYLGLRKGFAFNNFYLQENIGNVTLPVGVKLHARATVTGASSNHFGVLVEFLQDYKAKCQNIPLFTYDLGLTDTELAFLRSNFSWTVIRIFNYSQYPPHVRINVSMGEYAWKPIIVKEMLDTTTSAVLWLDSGDRLTRTDTLQNTFSQIERDGHITATSSGTTQTWVHPSTLSFLHVPNLNIQMCNAAIVGFDMRAYEKVVRPWVECALQHVCIAPPGATRKNHRQDQAVLTVLLYQAGRQFGTNSGLWVFDFVCEEFWRSVGTPSDLGIAIQQDKVGSSRYWTPLVY